MTELFTWLMAGSARRPDPDLRKLTHLVALHEARHAARRAARHEARHEASLSAEPARC